MQLTQQFRPLYDWIQKHIGMIIFLPTLIGGIWQILELNSLGTAYIRFFSVSQLVSDGLMVCYILLWMAMMGSIQVFDKKLMSLVIEDRVTVTNVNDEVESEELEPKGKLTSAIMLLLLIVILGLFTYYILEPKFSQVLKDQILTVSNLMDFTYYSIFLALMARNGWRLFLSATDTHAFFLRHHVQNTLRFLGLLLIVGVLYLSLYFLQMFHNSFLIPKDFKNMEYIMCKIKKGSPGLKSAKIEYFNDKYVFIRLSYNNKKPAKTEVVSFESFLDAEACSLPAKL